MATLSHVIQRGPRIEMKGGQAFSALNLGKTPSSSPSVTLNMSPHFPRPHFPHL